MSKVRGALTALGKAVLGQSIETFYVRVRELEGLEDAQRLPPASLGPGQFVSRLFAYIEDEKRCITATTDDVDEWLALPQQVRETVRRVLKPKRFDKHPCPCRGLCLQTEDWTVCSICGHAWGYGRPGKFIDRAIITDVHDILRLDRRVLLHVETDGEPTGECVYCHEQMPRKFLTRDHVHPRRVRGRGGHSPIVLACARCNNKKGEMTVVSFTDWLASPQGQNWLASRPRTPKAPWR